MNQLEEFERVNNLLSIYGELLTEAQKKIMDYYYGYNLSLKEISDELGVSRTAVSDALKTSLKKLEHFESVLKIDKKSVECSKLIAKIKENPSKENIEELERMIKNGI